MMSQDLLPASPPYPPIPRAIVRVVKARRKGAILYYDFEGRILLPPPLRSKVIDKSGHGNNGVLKNDAHIEDSRLVLDGVDDYLDVPDSIPVGKSITVLAWAKSNLPTWNVRAWIASSRVANGFIIHPVPDSRMVRLVVYDDGGNFHGIGRVTPSDITQWHQYGLVYDYDTKKAYTVLDGDVIEGKKSPLDITRTSDTIPVDIGRDYEKTDRYGDGKIDEVRIYDRAL